ncbi:MAG: NapC/NirT family cytochrome c [Pseudomonadota bacterium]
MLSFPNRSIVLAGCAGVLVGIFSIYALEKTDQWTSTDAFCGTGCHAMEAHVANEPAYLTSIHRTTATGIRAGCADCHIPEGLIAATWTHITAGIRDSYSALMHDFSTREAWNARRNAMAFRVRDWMLANDSETCRACHQREALNPRRARGKRQHELAERQGVTCIGCHFDLVHEPVRPRQSFLERVQVRSVVASESARRSVQ